ncbi:subtilase [Plectosphaerella plurivora]|uniref:Subtilase n=1 Tax=Plectosphaerella plurivora TaxID=936078 RepID=A0A9P8VDK6_9PEZI|nr:subtilase [Plectosphaerella plurivora]
MRRPELVNLAVLLLPFVGGTLALSRKAGDKIPSALAAKGYIIEYSRHAIRRRQEELADTPGIAVLRTFESDIFSGMSIETELLDADELAALPEVLNVWPNKLISLDASRDAPLATTVPTTFTEDASTNNSYRDPNAANHNITGVSRLHELGIFGKGVKIGVIDSGIAYDHSALGGGIGEGFKVAGGWDFVGDGNYPSDPAAPDANPYDRDGHGTHVAGIIAGKNEYWTGVAPEATLYAYKVFGAPGSFSSTEAILEAFLRSYEDGMDIISVSIYAANGWGDAVSVLGNRLVDEGLVVVMIAGNRGEDGPFTSDSLSVGRNILSVASVEAPTYSVPPFEVALTLPGASVANVTRFAYFPGSNFFPATIKDWPVIALNLDTTVSDDACAPLPAGTTPDLSQAVVLVRRGGCTFIVKQTNLQAAGAKYVLLYSDDRPAIFTSNTLDPERLGMITAEAGAAIIAVLAAGGSVTADFSVDPRAFEVVEVPNGGTPSQMTTWGGVNDLEFKPDIAAPGSNIYSTYVNNGYATLSGTSMACPYVSGIAALWISVHGGRDINGKGFARQLRQRILTSGASVAWSTGPLVDKTFKAPTAQIGNGIIDAWKVLQYQTRLEFESFALNDTQYFRRDHDVTIFNEGNETVTYTWGIKHGAGVEALGYLPSIGVTGFAKRLKSYVELEPLVLEIKVSLPQPLTLEPGQSRMVTASFSNPDTLGWNASTLPMYGGKVILTGDNGEQLSIPFFGVGADVRREVSPVIHEGYPILSTGPDDTPITSNTSISFNLGAQEFVRLVTRHAWGTRQLRWDIFEAAWTEGQWQYPPTVGENGYIGPVACWNLGQQGIPFDPAVHDANATFTMPEFNQGRNSEVGAQQNSWAWFGKLGNGSQIENGRYLLRFALLKPFGIPEASGDWEIFMSPEFAVTGRY